MAAATSDQRSQIESSGIHLDAVLKLAALIAAVANAALLTFGYMRYLALMEVFGIARSEVSFSVADLLAYGYGDFINRIFSSFLAQAIFGASVGVVGMLIYAFTWTGRSSWRRDAATMGISLVVVAVPAIPMLMSYFPAQSTALALAAEHLKVEKEGLQGLRKRFEFETSQGLLSGDVLLTTPEYTFLLAENVVYKIRTENNAVVRKTYLEAKLKNRSE